MQLAKPGNQKSLDRRITYGFAVATLALAGIGFYSQLSPRRIQEVTSRRASARQTRLQIELLFSTIKDAETGQRGFLLTQKDSYLAPYELARRALPERLESVRALTVGDVDL